MYFQYHYALLLV